MKIKENNTYFHFVVHIISESLKFYNIIMTFKINQSHLSTLYTIEDIIY